MNAAGELIGINSQILSPSDGNIGLGFAIPSNMAKNVMDQLIASGTVRRAKLGVTVQRITRGSGVEPRPGVVARSARQQR